MKLLDSNNSENWYIHKLPFPDIWENNKYYLQIDIFYIPIIILRKKTFLSESGFILKWWYYFLLNLNI